MTEKGFDFDLAKVRRSFSRAASSYDEAAFLQREVADRMLERLDYIRLQPRAVLDLGTGTGYCCDDLLRRYKSAHLVALDFAEGMLKMAAKRGRILRRPSPVCASAESLPFADSSFGLLVSNLMLQWCHPVDEYFREFYRVLEPGGLLMFTSFGPDTLMEMRAAWQEVDGEPHVHGFLDMHDVGDALFREGFVNPVMDAERIVLTFGDVLSLLRELKAIGASNAEAQRLRGLTGRHALKRFAEAYEAFRSAEGVLPATYEVVYGHAWVPEAKREVGDAGRSFIPIFPVG